MNMLAEVGSHLKIFVTETCDLLIEKLSLFKSDLEKLKYQLQNQLEKDKNRFLHSNLYDDQASVNNTQSFLMPSSSKHSKMRGFGFSRKSAFMPKMDKREILQNQIKANEEKEKALELKLKNTNRALNIAKTLFGMVDELDSTDFGA